MTNKKLIFSVTAKDCDWSYTKGTGSGGQKKNKTSSAVHCTHRASGAHGYAEDTRSQRSNKELAFKRMAESKEFKTWHKLETARRNGDLERIEAKVRQEMNKVKVEVKEDGKWVEVDKNAKLDDSE